MSAWIARLFRIFRKVFLKVCSGLILSAAVIFLFQSSFFGSFNSISSFNFFKNDDVITLSGFTMGTSYTIQVANFPEKLDRELLAFDIQARLDYLDKSIFSTYVESSALSQLNGSPINTPVEVPTELAVVLLQALEIYQMSQHSFDVTIAPLVNLWGFGPESYSESPPPQFEIERAKDGLSSDYIEVSSTGSTVLKARELDIDLSAIAKGYAVDQIASVLDSYAISDYIVEIGGELIANGYHDNHNSWRLAIETPTDNIQSPYVTITNNGNKVAVASSGSYRNYFNYNGEHYSHEIDPRTGSPITHNLVSVTVISDQASEADALATALMILGPIEGFKLASSVQVPAYFIMYSESGFSSRYTPWFNQYITNSD